MEIDTEPLEEYARSLQQHYEQLSERLEELEESKRRVVDDRAYM